MNAYHVSLSCEQQKTLLEMYHFAPKRRLRQRAHMVLLSNQGYCQKEVAKDFNSREFLLLIEQLQRQYVDETVVIVMDNAPAHGYRKIHGEVLVNEQLYFYFLPPYTAAKLNPVEKVFRFFRAKVTHNEYFPDITDLIEAARNFFRYLYVCRSRVASLIHAEA